MFIRVLKLCELCASVRQKSYKAVCSRMAGGGLTYNFRFITTKSTKVTKGSFILPNFVFFVLFVVKSSLISLESLSSLQSLTAASRLTLGYWIFIHAFRVFRMLRNCHSVCSRAQRMPLQGSRYYFVRKWLATNFSVKRFNSQRLTFNS